MAALFVWQIIIALVYFLLRTRVAGRQEAAVESVLVLLLPGVGIVSLLVWLLVSRLAHFHAVEPGDRSGCCRRLGRWRIRPMSCRFTISIS